MVDQSLGSITEFKMLNGKEIPNQPTIHQCIIDKELAKQQNTYAWNTRTTYLECLITQ